MIHVRYSNALSPAAPFVKVLLRHDARPAPTVALDAQLDTGADRTVIPFSAAAKLGLEEIGELDFGGIGDIVRMPIYLVTVQIPGVMDFTIEAAASDDEPRVLLGRDVLNCLYATLSGPTRFLELSDQPLPTPATP